LIPTSILSFLAAFGGMFLPVFFFRRFSDLCVFQLLGREVTLMTPPLLTYINNFSVDFLLPPWLDAPSSGLVNISGLP